MTDVEIVAEVPILWGGDLRAEPDAGDPPPRVLMPPIGVDARFGSGVFGVEVGYRQSAGAWQVGQGVGGSTGFLHADLVVRSQEPGRLGYVLGGAGVGAGYAKLSGYGPRLAAAPNVMLEGGVVLKDRWKLGLRADTHLTVTTWEPWTVFPEGTLRWTWATANPGLRVVAGALLGKR